MLALVSLLAVAAFGRISHQGERILRCRYEDGSHINRLEDLEVDIQAVLADGFVDVRVQRPSDMEHIKQYLSGCEVLVEDLEAETVKFELANNASRARWMRGEADWFEAYHTYTEISAWFEQLSIDYPTLVRWTPSIALSSEGRAIFAVSIFNYGVPPNGGDQRRPQYRSFMTAGIHAREWISPATLQYISWQLLETYTTNPDDVVIHDWVNQVETIVLGDINPDGYEFTWTDNRQWRKNRRPPPLGFACFGVDQNRNFPDHWGEGGSSTNPCSDTYMGPSANSESENRGIVQYFQQQSQQTRIILAIDWHSYGQLFLRPYGWTDKDCPDEPRFVALGNTYVGDILGFSGKIYTSQKSIQLYVTTGTASDWYYGASNVDKDGNNRTAGWTVELRPVGAPGFVLPPQEIIPTGAENWFALHNLFQSIHTEPLP
jgi:carboxypeptidase A1